MDFVLAAATSMLAMTAIVAVRYVAVSGGFAWLTARRLPGLYSEQGRQIRAEIGWSLISALIYGLPAGLVAFCLKEHACTEIYTDRTPDKSGGKLVNVEFDKFDRVKDPAKEGN